MSWKEAVGYICAPTLAAEKGDMMHTITISTLSVAFELIPQPSVSMAEVISDESDDSCTETHLEGYGTEHAIYKQNGTKGSGPRPEPFISSCGSGPTTIAVTGM